MGIWNFSVIKKQVKKSETWLFLIKTLKSPFSMGIVAQKGFPREGESKVLIKTRKSRFSMGIVAHKGFSREGESKVLIKTRKSRFSMGIVAHKGFPREGESKVILKPWSEGNSSAIPKR